MTNDAPKITVGNNGPYLVTQGLLIVPDPSVTPSAARGLNSLPNTIPNSGFHPPPELPRGSQLDLQRQPASACKIKRPCLVTGGIPLVFKTPVMVEHGEPLTWKKGGVLNTGASYALCRCGISGNEQFCDGTETGATEPVSERETSYLGDRIMGIMTVRCVFTPNSAAIESPMFGGWLRVPRIRRSGH